MNAEQLHGDAQRPWPGAHSVIQGGVSPCAGAWSCNPANRRRTGAIDSQTNQMSRRDRVTRVQSQRHSLLMPTHVNRSS